MVVQITPPAIANIGWKTYIIFAILNACWVPVIYFVYPETKGLELEDVDRIFAKGQSGVAETLFTDTSEKNEGLGLNVQNIEQKSA